MANHKRIYLDDYHVRMREYGQQLRDRKKLAKEVGKGKKPLRDIPPTFIKSIQPTRDNFLGTDETEPIVCSSFGCATHLTPEQQLYNPKCYSCQCKQKIDPTRFVSHPIKKSA